MSKVPRKTKESKILQAARYLETGRFSQNQIATACHMSKNLVSVISTVMTVRGLSAADVEAMREEVRKKTFRRNDLPEPSPRGSGVYAEPDYDYYCKELLRPGVTKALLHEEYVEECRRSGLVPLQLTQFKVHLGEHLQKKPFSEIIQHKPGEETEVDWTGDPARWTDPDTGEVQNGWLFVGVLPFSGYSYAEVFSDMKLPNWITAHVHMYEYFGGITRTLICDNLKTGVIKHPVTGDVILQKDYEAFANYYGIIIAPARVRRPNDKPTAENAVGNLETQILARLRNFQCFSLKDYNAKVLELLDAYNARQFQKKEGSRLSVYREYEEKEMIPLPAIPYEYYESRSAYVQPNCCFAYDRNFYSVPYRFMGQTIEIRIFNDRIEGYAGNQKLCTHHRISGVIGQYDIDNSHLPPYSAKYGKWNSTRLKNWANTYGPYTYEVVDRIFERGGAEQRYYNGVISLLKLADSYPQARVEQACQLGLKRWRRPTYKNIKAILAAGQFPADSAGSPQNGQKPCEEKSYVRGAEYYAKKKD